MLFVYSVSSLTKDIVKIKNEDKTFIYTREFSGWFISFVANLLILGVLVVRIGFLVFQSSLVKTFKRDGFIHYFPVNYYYYNYELFIVILELIMLIVVLMNISNVMYPEFFLLIKLTFNNAGRLLLSYFLLLSLMVISTASTFWVVFNSYVSEFQTFALSTYSVFFFENLSNTSLLAMMESQYLITFAMVLVYLFFSIFYLNYLFVILLDSFTTIKTKNPLNLIMMETIFEGITYYFENLYISIWKYFRRSSRVVEGKGR